MNNLGQLKDSLKNKMSSQTLEGFLNLYNLYKNGNKKLGDWESLSSPDIKRLPTYGKLPFPNNTLIKRALHKLVVCKLNGGLGTTMGCQGPKSGVIVREGLSFLDLIVGHLKEINNNQKVAIPLVLMNSFYTHHNTNLNIGRYHDDLNIESFQQNRYPRLMKDSEVPLNESLHGSAAWYPPGHGDFYHCVKEQKLLDRWLDEGKELLFISNADNLGGVVDERIASFMLESDHPFLMEVTEKTIADVKGGTLYQDGEKLRLLEVAQVPRENIEDFYGTEKFKFFNTNNIWINLVHLKNRFKRGPFSLRVIENSKKVNSIETIQLETAMGFGIENFSNSIGLIVPRDRYSPVKSTSDLFLVQSDLFILDNGRLLRNPKRKTFDLPVVRFGSQLSHLLDYQNSVPEVPSLIELDSLIIDGDVKIGKEVTLKGRVVLTPKNYRLSIPSGTVLVNEEIV